MLIYQIGVFLHSSAYIVCMFLMIGFDMQYYGTHGLFLAGGLLIGEVLNRFKRKRKKLLKLQRLQKFEYSLFLRINYNGSD